MDRDEHCRVCGGLLSPIELFGGICEMCHNKENPHPPCRFKSCVHYEDACINPSMSDTQCISCKRFYKDENVEDIRGVYGEWVYYKRYEHLGCAPPDRKPRPYGDKGIDFHTPWGTLDVKTARKPKNLLVKKQEIGRVADVLVQAGWNEKLQGVELLGWYIGQDMRDLQGLQEPKDFGYGIINYFVPASQLHAMELMDDSFEWIIKNRGAIDGKSVTKDTGGIHTAFKEDFGKPRSHERPPAVPETLPLDAYGGKLQGPGKAQAGPARHHDKGHAESDEVEGWLPYPGTYKGSNTKRIRSLYEHHNDNHSEDHTGDDRNYLKLRPLSDPKKLRTPQRTPQRSPHEPHSNPTGYRRKGRM